MIDSFYQLCNATTTANVQTFALDELLQAITTNANSDDQRIDALDFGYLSQIFFFFMIPLILSANDPIFSDSYSSE